MKSRVIIFATKNRGKLNEIRKIFQDSDFEIKSMEEVGIDIEVVEDGTTFEENAIKKAETIMKEADMIVLADDSGLEVDFFDKAPGIYSARFGGVDTPYTIKNNEIIKGLEGIEVEKRTARFVCVIAAAFPDGRIFTTKGVLEGRIGYEEKGNNGFGYDPIFYVPQYHMTTGEMTPDLKNEISHRGQALAQMKKILETQKEK